MTEGKHTPGEWFRDGTTVYALNDQGTNRMLISCGGGFVYQPHDRTSLNHERTPSNEVEANAILIAAAPEMLGVLVEALAIYNARDRIATLDRAGYRRDEERESLERRCDEWLAKRREAIAKATGAS